MVITQLVVRTETTDNTPVSVRVISSANAMNSYVPTKMLIRSEPEYADLLERAKRELRAFQQKYITVVELQEIFLVSVKLSDDLVRELGVLQLSSRLVELEKDGIVFNKAQESALNRFGERVYYIRYSIAK